MKRILILDGHPAAESLSRSLASSYASGARSAGHEVRIVHLHDLHFDSDFGAASYSQLKPLEPSLALVLEDLLWSNHFVLTLPMWWGGLPAKLKGLFDRALLPGHAFDTRNPNWLGMPRPLLDGRTARVLITSDTPSWWMRLAYKNALIWQLRGQVLAFIGIKPARFTLFGPASHPKPGKVDQWRKQMELLGKSAF
jgi:NAD(P)H dehydrogenase (quinone)